MKTLVRTLLVWFVLLAVPFQGFAAAAMTCAHGVSTASAGAPAQPPCHGDGAQAGKHGAGHALIQDSGQDSGHDDASSSHQTSCGNCSACSVGAAMAPASNAQAPSCCPCSCCPCAAPAPVALADPDLPERPPRTSLPSRS
ncbi:MAG: hypothetical protein EOP92_21470 [Lysobacteraceae bacterium]|nr:MAG: hypothetical protein EOP92_21470 [Xanthomonadaceae bacterium]